MLMYCLSFLEHKLHEGRIFFFLSHWCIFGRILNKLWLTDQMNRLSVTSQNSLLFHIIHDHVNELRPSGHWLKNLSVIRKSKMQIVLGISLLVFTFLSSELLLQYSIWYLGLFLRIIILITIKFHAWVLILFNIYFMFFHMLKAYLWNRVTSCGDYSIGFRLNAKCMEMLSKCSF